MTTPTIISRKDASERHSTTFFTGLPCKAGHVERRYVSNGSCVACCKAKAAAFNNVTRGKSSAPVHAVPLSFHPDDAEAVYALIDYLNAQRGMAPTPRPKVLPAVPKVDTRTPWEQAYDLHRERYTHAIAHRLASSRTPETHSPGWSHPSWGDDHVVIKVTQPPTYGGAAKPDYL